MSYLRNIHQLFFSDDEESEMYTERTVNEWEGGIAQKGSEIFSAKCSQCHTLVDHRTGKKEGHRMGPNLVGIIGRRAGSVEGFTFSEVMKSKGITWSGSSLFKFLESPQNPLTGGIPGTKMGFAGLKKSADRKNLIAFLSSYK